MPTLWALICMWVSLLGVSVFKWGKCKIRKGQRSWAEKMTQIPDVNPLIALFSLHSDAGGRRLPVLLRLLGPAGVWSQDTKPSAAVRHVHLGAVTPLHSQPGRYGRFTASRAAEAGAHTDCDVHLWQVRLGVDQRRSFNGERSYHDYNQWWALLTKTLGSLTPNPLKNNLSFANAVVIC